MYDYKNLYDDPFGTLSSCFAEDARENGAVAALTTLAFLAGGTDHAFSLELEGEGKTRLAARVATLGPTEGVCFASQMSVAGLFALEKRSKLKVLVCDELPPEPEFDRIKRQLITEGQTRRYVSDTHGKLREEIIAGPVSVITCIPDGQAREYRDASRVLVCRLSDSAEQQRHHARQVARARTQSGWQQQADWNRFANHFRRFMRNTGAPPRRVSLPAGVEDAVPSLRCPHLARRVDLGLRVGSSIAALRWRARGSQGDTAKVVLAQAQDISDGFDLIRGARVADDQQTVSQRDMDFLTVLGQLDWKQNGGLSPYDTGEGLTIVHLLHQLNGPRFSGTAAAAIDASKRRGNVGEIMWTRRVIKPRLEALRDAGLLGRNGSSPYYWVTTPLGKACLSEGMPTTLTHIHDAFKKQYSPATPDGGIDAT